MEIGLLHNAVNLQQDIIKIKSEDIFHDEKEDMSKNKAVSVSQDNTSLFSSLDIPSLTNINPLLDNNLEEELTVSLRPESRAVVDNLIEKIKQLSILQKMLLYLKLPSSRENAGQLDPLRRPVNPLGNRMEVGLALAYIRTHFIPDPDVSLTKKDIYHEYVEYCSERKAKPLSTADFGKAMKQVYPVVRPRRLGERGNSRYCYSGLCKREQLNKPRTPGNQNCISKKICSWASFVLNVPVDNLTHLSSIIPVAASSNGSENVHYTNDEYLQRDVLKKVAEKRHTIEVEREDSSEPRASKQRKTSTRQKLKAQKSKGTKGLKPSLGTTNTGSQNGENPAKANLDDNVQSKVCDTTNQNQINFDIVNIKDSHNKHVDLITENSTNVKKRKKASTDKRSAAKKSRKSKEKSNTTNVVAYNNKASPERRSDPLPAEGNFGIASIEEEPLFKVCCDPKKGASKEMKRDDAHHSNNRRSSDSIRRPARFIHKVDLSVDSNEAQDCDHTDNYTDVGYLKTENLNHYLQDEGNSQEPEEELLKYFKDPAKVELKEYNTANNISHLRLLLEQNLPEDNTLKYNSKLSGNSSNCRENISKTRKTSLNDSVSALQRTLQQPVLKSTVPSVLHNSNSKRRVSFENIPDSFLESPNTHHKSFSFTPISPRPPTVSKSSVSVSPFVFPRDTVFRGKLSINGNLQQHSPVSQGSTQSHLHSSPLKSISRSTSFSSTPSPINTGQYSSNTLPRGRSTPQEHTDSGKYSPLVSPSSSSGVFLSPASPMSSCNSPIFSFRKSMSPVKQTDSFSKPNPSLLHTLLVTGKCPEVESFSGNVKKLGVTDGVGQKPMEPLDVDVHRPSLSGFSHFRSQSVPTLTCSKSVSPSSDTQPFHNTSLSKRKEIPPLLEIKQSELDAWNSFLNGYKSTDNNLILESISDNDTTGSGSQALGNEVSVESVISNLYDIISCDKGTGENVKPQQISRSHPNTPSVYNECSNSRDPVVSAFPAIGASKSYPCTPTACMSQTFSNVTTSGSSSAKRNLIPLLDNLTIPVPSFSEEIGLELLDNLTELSGCDDAFNNLAKEVANSDAELQ